MQDPLRKGCRSAIWKDQNRTNAGHSDNRSDTYDDNCGTPHRTSPMTPTIYPDLSHLLRGAVFPKDGILN